MYFDEILDNRFIAVTIYRMFKAILNEIDTKATIM